MSYRPALTAERSRPSMIQMPAVSRMRWIFAPGLTHVHRPLHDDGRVVRPVGHAVPDRHGHIDPCRFAGFSHGRSAESALSPAIFGSFPQQADTSARQWTALR